MLRTASSGRRRICSETFCGRTPRRRRCVSTIAPIIASVTLAAVVVFAIVRFDLLVGGEPGERLWMLLILLAFPVAGSLVARYLKQRKPDLYQRLGRAEGDDVASDPTGESQAEAAATTHPSPH